MRIKVYQNRLAFVEDMTKTFWCVYYWFTVYVLINEVEYIVGDEYHCS